MAPLYPPWANPALRIALVLAMGALVAFVVGLFAWVRSPYATGATEIVDQPVQFDHRHHVGDAGIDCRYCHTEAERSPYAGIPSSALCMNCHAQIWNRSPLLAPVRESYARGEPLRWNRVHRLPDFVFFNHAAHVDRGVGCVSCHGHVEQMAQVYPVAPLTMGWCLDCHRDPTPNLRPRSEVTNADWQPVKSARDDGAVVQRTLRVQPPTNCSGCHR